MENTWLFFVGIVVFLSISLVDTPPKVSIPKDKILTVTTASDEMVNSYINISKTYDDQIKIKNANYERESLSDEDNERINELFAEFEDEDTGTLH